QAGQPPGAQGRRPGSRGGNAPQGLGNPTPGQGAGRGGMGGLLNGSTPGAAVTKALKQNAGRFTWVAAAVGSNSASGYQLATGKPVMPIGGFNGSDPSPTLAEFQKLVTDGRIHYFIGGGGGGLPGGGAAGGGMRSMGGSNQSQAIATWVEQTYAATTVDGVTLYDLTDTRTDADVGDGADESSPTV
ncbi:glycosyl transferase, partial [Streptomyces sp. SID3343]|nr:glycosyl transferase [Streptomyces sp. SID3343]